MSSHAKVTMTLLSSCRIKLVNMLRLLGTHSLYNSAAAHTVVDLSQLLMVLLPW